MKEYPETDAGRIEKLNDQNRLLQLRLDALEQSHRQLAKRVIGDSPELVEFLGEIEAYQLENRPEDLK